MLMKWLVIAAVLLAAILLVGAVALASTRGGSGAPVGRMSVPAPIDQVEIVVRESAPPQVAVKITAGLPSGCAQRESHALSRNGDTFTVTVLNSMPRGDQACTMIYGTYSLSIDLVGELRPGVTYTVQVNDKTTTFKT
ncbi:MAG: hypothetical protein M3Q61_05620 [Chloroflexota bacterium]|nr:hypothetical protein [Chloroflexota bacterium]